MALIIFWILVIINIILLAIGYVLFIISCIASYKESKKRLKEFKHEKGIRRIALHEKL